MAFLGRDQVLVWALNLVNLVVSKEPFLINLDVHILAP